MLWLFVTTFSALYGVLNLYMLRWFRPAFGWGRLGTSIYVVFMLCTIALHMISHVLARDEYFRTARLTAGIAYGWLLVMMVVVSLGLLADAWNLVIAFLSPRVEAARNLRIPARALVAAAVVALVFFISWGLVEARHIRISEVVLKTSRFPPGARPLRVVQISDVQLGEFVGEGQLDRAVKLIETCRPDLLVSTGDLLDTYPARNSGAAEKLAAIKAPLGKFAVTGNHEYYIGLKRSIPFTERAGFRVLRQEKAVITDEGRTVLVAGVDDPTGAEHGQQSYRDEDAVLPNGPDRPYTILLKHRARVSRDMIGRFDLQLCGHTHGGQIFPFHFMVKIFHPQLRGLKNVGKGSWCYVNAGAGTWGPPLRVLARPEIALIVIEPEDQRPTTNVQRPTGGNGG